MKFRRKSADPVETEAEATPDASAVEETPASGPYDAESAPADGFPRLDLGALLLPAVEGVEVRMQVDEGTDEVRSVLLAINEGAIELRAFAAPRNGDLWGEVRPRIAADFAQRGGTATEHDGRWGPELHCQLTVNLPDGRTGTQPSRIIGINGSRWMLRATLLGRAAIDADTATTWESVIEKVFVRRGDQAMPVGSELPLRVPAGGEMRNDG